MDTGEYTRLSDRALECPGSLDVSPVDPFKEHRQLCRREGNGAALGLRPHEPSPLQTLREEAKTVAIEPEALHDIASSSAEDKHMTGEGLQLEHGLDLGTQPMEAATHIGEARSDPDPGT